MSPKKEKQQIVIKIMDVKKFVSPLRSLSKSVNSIVLAVKDNTLAVNTRSEDNSQIANILFKPEIVTVENAEDGDKYGIYNLNEFLSVLTLSDANSVDIVVSGNSFVIHYGDKAQIEYILSDLTLISEGPTELKAKVDFVTSFDVTPDFIKKVKNISTIIGASVLKIKGEDGYISYSIINKSSQSHSYNEKINDEVIDELEKFDVSISIKDDKRDNFGFLFENCNYTLSVHEKIIKIEGITEEYGMLRYFLAPLA